jgi:hypothetical protein
MTSGKPTGADEPATGSNAPRNAVRRSFPTQVPVIEPDEPAPAWARSAEVMTSSPESRRSVKLVGGVQAPPDQFVADHTSSRSEPVVVTVTAGLTVPSAVENWASVISHGSPDVTQPVKRVAAALT